MATAVTTKHTRCYACTKVINQRYPHVLMSVTLQALRTDGTAEVQATNIIGVWHPRCARTWPDVTEAH
jgi:hypothetical protein